MPEISIELTCEKIIEAASKLSENDKERLFFTLNNNLPVPFSLSSTLEVGRSMFNVHL